MQRVYVALQFRCAHFLTASIFSVSRYNLYAVSYFKENAAKSEYFIRTSPLFKQPTHKGCIVWTVVCKYIVKTVFEDCDEFYPSENKYETFIRQSVLVVLFRTFEKSDHYTEWIKSLLKFRLSLVLTKIKLNVRRLENNGFSCFISCCVRV
jgi:hypothetical protein